VFLLPTGGSIYMPAGGSIYMPAGGSIYMPREILNNNNKKSLFIYDL
jgi:hypothetical protein